MKNCVKPAYSPQTIEVMRTITITLPQVFFQNKPNLPCFAAVLPFFLLPLALLGQSSTVDAGLRFENKKGEKYPVVSQVWKFSSAEDEGIRAGEILWSLDGASTESLRPHEVVSRLGGKEGDKHTLLIGKDKREVKVKLRRLTGKCASGNCKTGRGVFDEPDARYEGDFVQGKYEGKGVMSYLSGNRHEGTYRAGKREGHGKFIFATGTTYEGNFSNNNFNGEGKLKYKTGEVYDGEFLDDERTGEGVATWPNGDRYEGLWSGDLRNGFGTMTYADGGVYTGVWRDGKREGFGKMTSFEGWTYEGNWVNDLRHGFGKLRKKNGERIEGVFQNDELPIDPVTSSGAIDPVKKSTGELGSAPVVHEMNREEASFLTSSSSSAPTVNVKQSTIESAAIADFIQNSPVAAQKLAISGKNIGQNAEIDEPKMSGAIRPGGTQNLPTASNRKMPTNLNKDGWPRIRLVKILDGFFDNAAAADSWLVDNERITRRSDKAENMKGLSTMTGTWAASAKNNFENFGKDLNLPGKQNAAEICDQFLRTNYQLAEKYMRLANLLSINIGAQKGDGQTPEIEAVRLEIREIWPTHEAQYLAARKLFF